LWTTGCMVGQGIEVFMFLLLRWDRTDCGLQAAWLARVLRFLSLARARDFMFLLQSFHTGPGITQYPVKWIWGAILQGVKWLGCEADHFPLFSAMGKNTRNYTATPSHAFMMWCLMECWDSFISFTFKFSLSTFFH